MIYRLRRKFILICMLSFLIVFLLLFASIYCLTYCQAIASLDMLADVVSENNGNFPALERPESEARNPFSTGIEHLTVESPFTTRFFTVRFDASGSLLSTDIRSIASVTENTAEEYARAAVNKRMERGWIDDFRYKVNTTAEGKTVVFIHGTTARRTSQQLLWAAAAVFLIGSVVVLVLIVLISKRAVKPTAESYEKQKQFITDANHELKTPLTLIQANLDIAESEVGKNEWLEDIREEGEKMTELVNCLVTLARMDEEHTPLETTPFDLSNALADTVAAFSSAAEKREITLTSNIPPLVQYKGNETAFRQLVSILMDNAVKYCDPSGTITVTLQDHGGRRPVFTIENSFQAVDSIELSRLFDRFYRADKARTYGSGFGIGLSIAKAIVEQHHGEIQAQNLGRKTIRFWVRLC